MAPHSRTRSLLIALVASFMFPHPARAATVGEVVGVGNAQVACGAPDWLRGRLGLPDQALCDAAEARVAQFACTDCPSIATVNGLVKRYRANAGNVVSAVLHPIRNRERIREILRSPYERCFEPMARYLCQRSPWRDLTLEQRYQEITGIAARIDTWVDRDVAPCMAAKETQYLEPLTKSCSATESDRHAHLGLAQLDQSSFQDIFGGDGPTAMSRARGEAWMAPYSCPGSRFAKESTAAIFQAYYLHDPVLQVGALLKGLEQKAKEVDGGQLSRDLQEKVGQKAECDRDGVVSIRVRSGRSTVTRSCRTLGAQVRTLFTRLLNKNNNLSSGTQAAYGRSVMSCVDCLKTERGKQDPISCLSLATGYELPRGNPCAHYQTEAERSTIETADPSPADRTGD
jgi:hypothetical protein